MPVQVTTQLATSNETIRAETIYKEKLDVDAQNDIVTFQDMAFEKEKSHVVFLYLDIDLTQVNLFKVVKDNQLVYEVPHDTLSQEVGFHISQNGAY